MAAQSDGHAKYETGTLATTLSSVPQLIHTTPSTALQLN